MISVIVPIYNSEKYLRQCVDSLIHQTYKDIEIVLVDDGSTDSSPEICDNYAKMDSRIKVVHQKNARIGAARNHGIEVSTGEYITFIDSDDFLTPNAYEIVMEIFMKYNADIVQWDLTFVSENGEVLEKENKVSSNPVTLVLNREEGLEKLFQWKNMDPRFNHIWTATHCVWTKAIKREVLGQLKFPVGKEYEDEMILHKVLCRAKKSIFINERFSNYRLRDSSTVHTMPLKGKLDKVEAFADRFDMIFSLNNEKLLNGISHDLYITIFNTYLLAVQEQNKAVMKQLYTIAEERFGKAKGVMLKKEVLLTSLYLKMTPVFRIIYGLYRKMKSS